jgi:hypothetical protein
MPYQTKADTLWDAIQVTCDKDLNYFSLRTIAFDDAEPKDTDAKKRVEEQSNIYDISHILKHPYTCNLPSHSINGGRRPFLARTISIEISSYQEPHEHGECGLSPRYNLLIRINGAKVDEFEAYGINRCTNPETHLIELDQFNLLRTCTFPGSYSAEKQTSCNLLKVK